MVKLCYQVEDIKHPKLIDYRPVGKRWAGRPL